MKDIAADRIRDLFEDLKNDRKTLIKILTIIVILLLAGILRIHNANKADIDIESADVSDISSVETSDAEQTTGDMWIDIGGQVVSPGVYQVSEGTRLYQLIELAGGHTELADTDSINQASFVEDGEKIIIPAKAAEGDTAASGSESLSESFASSGISSDGIVNINIADKDELKTLNGIGDVIAERIIEYRNSNRFKNKEDIKSVKGIGDGIYEKIKDKITC